MKNNESVVHIVFVTDDNYALPTGVAITSLKINRATNISYEIHILCVDVSVINIEKLKDMECINFKISIKLMSGYSGFEGIKKKTKHVSLAAMYKFMLPELFPELNKILYLDGDIIIENNLENLYAINLEGNYIAAVADIIATITYNPNMLEKLKLNHEHYFNSGVMLLNLKIMREEGISAKLIDYRRNGINYFMDQDAFNAILGSKMIALNPINNDLNSMHRRCDVIDIAKFYQVLEEDIWDYHMRDTRIIHLTSDQKPWKFDIPFYTKLFMDYYAQSEFSDVQIELKELSEDNKNSKWDLKSFIIKCIKKNPVLYAVSIWIKEMLLAEKARHEGE